MRHILGLATLVLLELAFTGCAGNVGRGQRTARVDAILYSAHVRAVHDSFGAPEPLLQAVVTVTNTGRQPVALGPWPNCFFTTLELRPVDGGGLGPAWAEDRWRSAYARTTGIIVECDFASGSQEQALAPGASITFERQASRLKVSDVLGDSLPGGRYRAVLRVRPHTAPRDAPPLMQLDAGEVVLGRHAASPAGPVERGVPAGLRQASQMNVMFANLSSP